MYDELNIDLLTPTPFLNFDFLMSCAFVFFCFFYFLSTFVNKIDIDYGYFFNLTICQLFNLYAFLYLFKLI